jgi:hypothetical protein
MDLPTLQDIFVLTASIAGLVRRLRSVKRSTQLYRLCHAVSEESSGVTKNITSLLPMLSQETIKLQSLRPMQFCRDYTVAWSPSVAILAQAVLA